MAIRATFVRKQRRQTKRKLHFLQFIKRCPGDQSSGPVVQRKPLSGGPCNRHNATQITYFLRSTADAVCGVRKRERQMAQPVVSSRTRTTDPTTGGPNPRTPALRLVKSARDAVRGFAELLLERNGRYARAFENLILALIVLSVASVGVEAIPGLPLWATRALHFCEIGVVAIFSLEYVLRLVVATEKLKFIFSFYGLIDLLSIAPFYLAGYDARWLRTLRLLRLLRVLKLQRHVLETTVSERTRELAEKNVLLEQAQAQIKAELDVARALQIAILPASFPARPGCDSAARMIPATTMGGDFYDFIELPGGQIGPGGGRRIRQGGARGVLHGGGAHQPAPAGACPRRAPERASRRPTRYCVRRTRWICS